MAFDIPTRSEDLPTDAPRFIGKAVNRIEDPGLVSGTVEFIDNLSLPGMLHCAILRSPHPHARITGIDASAALALPGVEAVLTGEDVERWCDPCFTAPEGWGNTCLAVGKVRFVGEPVVAVAASSRYIAEDALELIQVDYELLTPVANPDAAMAPGAPLVFEERGTNVIQSRTYTWGEVDRVFAEADRIVSRQFRWNRVGANPTETFGCICQWDLADNSLTCRGAYQTPRFMAIGRAASLRLPANKVKIISHAQGGGFGGKGGPRGTDIAALLSRKSGGRPVKYVEDRMEYLLAGGGQSWDRYYDAALAVKADGTVTGFKVRLVDDQGAGAEGYGTISAAKPLAAFTGNYRIEAAFYDLTLVATNRAPTYPYRGYGPPPHNLVLESLMDIAARELALDPAELRRRNYIRPEQFPYTVPSGNEYDSGNYAAVLDRVLELADYRALRETQAQARAEGRLVGIGVVSTVEPGVFDWNAYATVGVPGVGVPEGVKVAVDVFGNLTVAVGFNLQGQGQFTVAAQVVADYLGVDMNSVKVTTASTDVALPHFGQGGSRLGVAVTGAILGACDKLRQTFCRVVAHVMHTEPDEIELFNGRLRMKHAPEQGMSIAEVAGLMLSRSDLLPPGVEPCPEASFVWVSPNRNQPDDQGRCRSYLTAAAATHVVQVEIDRGTGQVKILGYYIVDDCGTRLNPASVEGQLQGGVAQGVGAALYEEYVYDPQCQPLVSTFVDYLVPTIHEVPMTVKDHLVTPSPIAPLGAKGCGEGAIHTTPAALLCAINDALAPLGLECRETPASPQRLWKLLREQARQEAKRMSKPDLSQGPLAGLRVLDLSTMLAGPYGATLLGDLGADVIKIESHYGDESRHLGPKRGEERGPYLSLNRSKRDLVLDLQREEAQAIFARLAATADILVTNIREPALSKLGLDYEQVRQHKPDIIWIRVTAFGADGPYAGRPGIDFLAQGYTGVLTLNGDPQGEPVRTGFPAVDVMTSLLVSNAALAALRAREFSGEGQRIEVSLLDALMHAQASSIGTWLTTGDRPKRTGNRSLYFAPSGVYPTRDGKHVVITTPGEKFFAKVCRALGTDWDTDPRFHDIHARLANEDELDHVMAERTRQFDRAELVDKLVAADVLTAPINEVEDVVRDPQILHNRMIVPVEHPVLGRLDLTGVPIRFYGTPCEITRHPPMQGEHTREILGELGYAKGDVDALIGEGLVADVADMALRREARRARKPA